MARITISTRRGKREFWCPDAGGYVRLETEGHSGTLGRQICEGGGFMGSTLTADAETLPKVARRWLRQQRDGLRKNGLA